MKPKNWIVFLSDNHAQSAVGCYGNPIIKTPALDSLARNGTVYENAYCASPLCCPSRAAIATGRFPHQTGFSDNTIVYDGSVKSWMHRARDLGHDVVSIGKLHFRSGEDDNGFSEELLPMHILNGRGGTSMLLRANNDERQNVGQWELYHDEIGTGGSSYQQFDRDITRRAIEWLRDRQQNPSDKPWVLFVSYVSAHPPFKVPQHLLDQYSKDEMPIPVAHKASERNKHPVAEHNRHIMRTADLDDEDNLKRIARHYYALVSHLDSQIGEILSETAALELNDTRYMYTSDHGEMLGEQGLLGKFCGYEGSLRVPLIISGPDVPADAREDAPVSAVDLFPTILDGLGISETTAGPDAHGQTLFDTLDKDRNLFAEYHATATQHGTFILRKGKYKLLHHVTAEPELFDLESDPHECNNLAANSDYQNVYAKLTKALFEICDPEKVDAEIRGRQVEMIDRLGGLESIIADGAIVFSPTPGNDAETRKIGQKVEH